MVEKIAKSSPHSESEVARKAMGGFTDALLIDQRVRSLDSRARLGWQPTRDFIGSADDPRIPEIMGTLRHSQPRARRIVRSSGRGSSPLVHRFVDRDAGLAALVDAITAPLPTG